MTDEELALLRRQADENSLMIPSPSKAQLRELLDLYERAVAMGEAAMLRSGQVTKQ